MRALRLDAVLTIMLGVAVPYVQIKVSFRFDWIDELFVELTTLVFFVVSGYKFRPASNNPYPAIDKL